MRMVSLGTATESMGPCSTVVDLEAAQSWTQDNALKTSPDIFKFWCQMDACAGVFIWGF